MKFESDWTNTVVCIVPTRVYTQCPNWPHDPLTPWSKINRVPSSSHHEQLTCEVWKWLGKNCSLYLAINVLKTKCQIWPWPLTPWPKMNRVPPLIMNNLHVKFDSDWAKTVVCIVPTRFYRQSAKFDLDLWPLDPKSLGFLLSSWTMYVKYESDRAKTVVCIVSTGQSATDSRTHGLTHPPTHSSNHRRTAALLYPRQRCCEGITRPCINIAAFKL